MGYLVGFIPIKVAARELGVPANWLREQIDSGVVPSLKVGQRVLVNVEAAERALLDQASEGQKPERSA